jgi:hypothetical protein
MSESPSPTTHVLQSTAESVSPGTLDPARPPALTIDAGDIVSYPNTWTQWGNQAKYGMSFADREPLRRQFPSGPYSNLGPVEVRGADPGDVPAGTLHLTLNSVIDDTRTEPSVESVMLIVTTGSSPVVPGSARVIQTVRKTPAGWRVAARTISKQPSLG